MGRKVVVTPGPFRHVVGTDLPLPRADVVDARYLGRKAYVWLQAAVFDQLICVGRDFLLSDILLGGNEAYAIQKGQVGIRRHIARCSGVAANAPLLPYTA